MKVMFELRVSRILAEATEIEGAADMLDRLHPIDPITPAYDLKASARALRHAADRLEAISKRTSHAP